MNVYCNSISVSVYIKNINFTKMQKPLALTAVFDFRNKQRWFNFQNTHEHATYATGSLLPVRTVVERRLKKANDGSSSRNKQTIAVVNHDRCRSHNEQHRLLIVATALSIRCCNGDGGRARDEGLLSREVARWLRAMKMNAPTSGQQAKSVLHHAK